MSCIREVLLEKTGQYRVIAFCAGPRKLTVVRWVGQVLVSMPYLYYFQTPCKSTACIPSIKRW